ncbi:MAG TPA: GlsB/YeaQ/YmgE family stress response membrane protein [Thermoanaerobaculia bacterium]
MTIVTRCGPVRLFGVLWHRRCSTVEPTGRYSAGVNLEENMNFIGWILFGLVVGAIAKFLMPGRDPGGWIVTILLGVAGSFVGGFLASMLTGGGRENSTAGWIGSIIGAMVLLFIYRLIVGRRRVV